MPRLSTEGKKQSEVSGFSDPALRVGSLVLKAAGRLMIAGATFTAARMMDGTFTQSPQNLIEGVAVTVASVGVGVYALRYSFLQADELAARHAAQREGQNIADTMCCEQDAIGLTADISSVKGEPPGDDQ